MTETQVARSSRFEVEDLVPSLVRAPGVVGNLGVCVAIASTPAISRIRLNADYLPSNRDDLSSNLLGITDQGAEAFLEAFSSLSDISLVTKHLSKENGLLDQLEEELQDADSLSDFMYCRPILNRIKSLIARDQEKGLETQRNFQQFGALVCQVRQAVSHARSRTVTELSETKQAISQLQSIKVVRQTELEQSETKAQEAERQYNTIFERYEKRDAWFQDSVSYSVKASAFGAGAVAAVATAGVAGVVVLGGLISSVVSGSLLSSASKDLTAAEDRLRAERRAFYETEIELAQCEADLKLQANSVTGLEDTSKKIAIALWVLESLVSDINELVKSFRFMTQKIQAMLDYDQFIEDSGNQVQAKIQRGKDPKKQLQVLKKDISEMRKTAIIVRFYSELVAAVIQDVVIPGFRDASKTSHTNILDENVDKLVEDQREKMARYLEESERMCRALAQGAVKLYKEEHARAIQLEESISIAG